MLRLAFKHDPKGAAKIMSNIYTDDQRVSNLVDKLIKKNKINYLIYNLIIFN